MKEEKKEINKNLIKVIDPSKQSSQDQLFAIHENEHKSMSSKIYEALSIEPIIYLENCGGTIFASTRYIPVSASVTIGAKIDLSALATIKAMRV